MNARPSGRFASRRPDAGLRINQRIRASEIRLIYEGDQLGIMTPQQAQRIADDKGLDLVEISPRAVPPVCRIMDYGKYKFEESKKKQLSRKGTAIFETKEIKFRPKTEGHDMDFKVKHVRRFLSEGHKVRLVVVFRGREMVHPQMGNAVLDRVVKRCDDIATVETRPNMEGRRMLMIITPRPSVVQKALELKKEQAIAHAAARLVRKDSRLEETPETNDDLDEAAINADVDEEVDAGIADESDS